MSYPIAMDAGLPAHLEPKSSKAVFVMTEHGDLPAKVDSERDANIKVWLVHSVR